MTESHLIVTYGILAAIVYCTDVFSTIEAKVQSTRFFKTNEEVDSVTAPNNEAFALWAVCRVV